MLGGITVYMHSPVCSSCHKRRLIYKCQLDDLGRVLLVSSGTHLGVLGDAKIALRSGDEDERLTTADVHGVFWLCSWYVEMLLKRCPRRETSGETVDMLYRQPSLD